MANNTQQTINGFNVTEKEFQVIKVVDSKVGYPKIFKQGTYLTYAAAMKLMLNLKSFEPDNGIQFQVWHKGATTVAYTCCYSEYEFGYWYDTEDGFTDALAIAYAYEI